MDKVLAQITSFFAIWFNDIKKHVFKVEVINDKNKDLALLEKRLATVVSSLDLVSKQLENSNSGQTTTYIKGLTKRIDILLSILNSSKELNITKLENAVSDLVRAVKRTEVTGSVKVTNLPDTQKVKGDVNIGNLKDLVAGLQVVVDSINDLKLDMAQEMKGVSQSFVGMSGRAFTKIADGVNPELRATVLDYGNANPIAVRLTDTSGDYTAAGGGTEYTEGNIDASFTGGLLMAEGPSDTATPLQVDSSKLLQVDIAADSAGIGGGTQYTEGDTDVTITGTVAMMEVATNALQPVQGTVADGLLVNLGANNDISGTVTANLSATDNAVLDAIEVDTTTIAGAVSGTEMQVDVVAALPAGTNAIGKLAANSGVDIGDVDVTSIIPGTGATNLGKAVGAVAGATDSGVVGLSIRDDAITTLSDAEGDYVPTRVDANGALYVDLATKLDNVNDSILIYANTAKDGSGTDYVPLVDANGRLQVDVVSALPAGTNAIGKLAANSGVDIGDVDILSIAAGDNNIGNVDIASIAAGTNNIGDVDVLSVVPGTGATNLGKAIDTATGATDTGVLTLATRDDALSALTPIEGDNVQLRTDANGALWTHDDALDAALAGSELQVDVVTMPTVAVTQSGTWDEVGINDSGNAITVDWAGTAPPIGAGVEATALRVTLATDSTGVVSVDDNGGALTVDGTVTANLSATDNAVLDNIDADTSAIQTAVELIDDTVATLGGAIPAKAVQIAGLYDSTIPTAVDDGDAVAIRADRYGRIVLGNDSVTDDATYQKKYYTNAGAVTDGIVWSPAASTRWHVTDIYIQVSAAATVTLEDDLGAGDSAVWKAELAANQGWSHSFKTPLASGEDAADLLVTTSAGNVYITVTGYEL